MSLISSFQKIIITGKSVLNDPFHKKSKNAGLLERRKNGNRTDIINHLLTLTSGQIYLEIGVRNPNDNFNKINSPSKFSVDPGLETQNNFATFPFTSDYFFDKLKNNELDLKSNYKFDVIFIDGLHLAEQVDRDIANSLNVIKDDGFIVLHDCNPPDEYYAREDYEYINGPSGSFWNGTTWKAFYKARHIPDLYSLCVDCDWGVGVLTRRTDLSFFNQLSEIENSFFEFMSFDQNRSTHLNLIPYKDFIVN